MVSLVAERNSQVLRCLYNRRILIHKAGCPCCFLKCYRSDIVVAIGYHVSEFFLKDKFKCVCAHESGQDPVECKWAASALGVSKHCFAYFRLAAAVFELF